jgi:hypothetical protein
VVQERSLRSDCAFQMFYLGWLVGFDGGCSSGALAERPVPNSGVVVGGDGGTDVRWLSR